MRPIALALAATFSLAACNGPTDAPADMLAAGSPDDPKLVRISVEPPIRTMPLKGTQQLKVVAHYTDDGAAVSKANQHMLGVPWIRGTFLELADLPPLEEQKSSVISRQSSVVSSQMINA